MIARHQRYHRPVRCRHARPWSPWTRPLHLGPAYPTRRPLLTWLHALYAVLGLVWLIAFLLLGSGT